MAFAEERDSDLKRIEKAMIRPMRGVKSIEKGISLELMC